ncbi:transmembrane protein 245-like [Clytia hemisphaerica]|uniref:Transmembrane protein n=1 Tax=Clytia hemisphaerica TaxID=252671 RepID=A0A7M5XGD5_9CNID
MESASASPISFLHTSPTQHDKALKSAFYNTASFVFAIISGIILLNTYFVLHPFLRPLIWASLAGAFIFPFKRNATKIVHEWLLDLQVDKTPSIVGMMVLPAKVVSNAANTLGWVIKSYQRLLFIVFTAYVLFNLWLHTYFFAWAFQIFSSCHMFLSTLLALFSQKLIILAFVLGYIVLLFNYKKRDNQTFMTVISMSVWSVLALHLATYAGSLQIPISLLFLAIMGRALYLSHYGKLPEWIMEDDTTCYEHPSESVESSLHQSTKPTTIFHPPPPPVNSPAPPPQPPATHKKAAGLNRSNSRVADGIHGFMNMVGIKTITKSSTDTLLEQSDSDTSDYQPETIDTTNQIPKKPPSVENLIPGNPKTPTRPPKLVKRVALKLMHDVYKSKTGHSHKRIKRSSDPYFIALFWLFAISLIVRHQFILYVIVAPLLVFIALRWIINRYEILDLMLCKLIDVIHVVRNFYEDRKYIIFPKPVRSIGIFCHGLDQQLMSMICQWTDLFMTALIIVCMAFAVVLLTTLFAVQVHHESTFLLTVGANVVNKTIAANQDWLDSYNLNEEQVRQYMDHWMEEGYHMARKRVKGAFSSFIETNDTTTTDHLEAELTVFMDKLYEEWLNLNPKALSVTSSSAPDLYSSTEDVVKTDTPSEQQQPGRLSFVWKVYSYLSISKLTNIFWQNMHTMNSVMDSIFVIVKGNASLVINIIGHVLYVIFSSSTYVLNSIVSMIIFFTTLFYLLSSSKDEYKLLEWLTQVSMGTRLGESINNAVQEVFGASLKMACFYGVYTWITHSVFGANLVFIPSALAALLGVVPFIGTYWAAIPACLELLFIQNDQMRAVSLIVAHFVPTYVVDTAIYSEIGIHPYLTALAVAGGVIYLGLEGAFVGPFVLSCLIAAVDVYNRIMTNSNNISPVDNPKKNWRRSVSECEPSIKTTS